jgi:hypothetical protein
MNAAKRSKPVSVILVEFDDSGAKKGVVTVPKVVKTEAEWKKQLTPPQYAITAVLTRRPVAQVTGRGTGLDEPGLKRKIEVIERALEVNKPEPSDPLDVLRRVGGLEIAGLTGLIIGAVLRRIPVVIDGFISTSAAAVACALEPKVRKFLFAGHQSSEPGHAALLEFLGDKPLLDLQMRLGEGTGAALAMTLIEAAAKINDEMATFASAGVSEAFAAVARTGSVCVDVGYERTGMADTRRAPNRARGTGKFSFVFSGRGIARECRSYHLESCFLQICRSWCGDRDRSCVPGGYHRRFP